MRKRSVGRKAYENISGVGMRLYVKSEVDACRNVSVMSGQTDRQTDSFLHISLNPSTPAETKQGVGRGGRGRRS